MRTPLYRLLIAAVFLALVFAVGYQTRKPGSLELIIIDGTGGRPTPARVELLDGDKNPQVADDAIPVNGDCLDRAEAARMPLAQVVGLLSKNVKNPYTKRTEFYSVGKSVVPSLAAGTYRLRIHKGPEFNVEERELRVAPGEHVRVVVELSHWINLPQQGWYSADGHLHIARPVDGLNPNISKWMQAEDVHVANLLQWGNSRVAHNTLQYAFGKAGQYGEGDYVVAAAQENPRTHFRGHTVILGAKEMINYPESYLVFSKFFQEARRQRALSGYAHLGTWLGARYGMAIDLPSGLLNFLEILQMGEEQWTVYYDILNTGFRLTPTAGTDYPCLASFPGRERFYTKVDGSLTYESWLEGVRQGKTFVTNGPMLDLHVNGKQMGEELLVERAGTSVAIEGRVRFDTKRDSVERLELVENGEVVASYPRLNNAGEIAFRVQHEVRENCWLAVRSRGLKVDEASSFSNKSLAHSAPVFVTLKNATRLAQTPRGKMMARSWLARLDDIQARLGEDQTQFLANPGSSDGMTEAVIRRDRAALLANIAAARREYTRRLTR